MGLFDRIRTLAGKLDRDKEKAGFQFISPQTRKSFSGASQRRAQFNEPFKRVASGVGREVADFGRSAVKTGQDIGRPFNQILMAPFEAGRIKKDLQTDRLMEDYARRRGSTALANRYKQRSQNTINRFREQQTQAQQAAPSSMLRGALYGAAPIAGAPALRTGMGLNVGLNTIGNVISGRKPLSRTGQSAFGSIKFAGLNRLTSSLINPLVSKAGTLPGRMAIQGGLNVLEDVSYNKLVERRGTGAGEALQSLLLGAGFEALGDLKRGDIKVDKDGFIYNKAGRMIDPVSKQWVKASKKVKDAQTKFFESATGEKYDPKQKVLVPKADGRGMELRTKAKSRLGPEGGFARLGDEAEVKGKVKLPTLAPKAKLPAQKIPQDDFAATLGTPDQIKTKSPLQEANLKQSAVPGSKSLNEIVSQQPIDVKEKVGLLDYLRTPDRVLNKIGLKEEAKVLRKSYNAYLKELPVEIDRITKWSQQVPKESSQRIFQYLDGQGIELTKQELKVAKEVQGYLAKWADRLDLPKEKRITNYITHIFEEGFIQKEFDPDLARIISDKIPGSVYDPFTQQRLGKRGYVEDTWRALDAYVKRGVRKVNMDPALKQVKAASKNLEGSQYDYIKSYIDRINLRPTKIDNLVDNTIKQLPGVGYRFGQRPTAKFTRAGRQWVYRGTLGLNPGTALKNLTQGANTYSVLGEKYTIKGYYDLLTKGVGELEDKGVLGQDIIQDRTLSSGKQALQKFDKVLFSFFDLGEKINRGSAYYGAKAKTLAKGASEQEAVEQGLKVVRDTQFTFGSIDTPVALQSDISKLLTQFQSFSLKQSEFLGEKISKKDFAGLTRYILANIALIGTVGQAIGMDFKDMIPSFRIGAPPTLQAPIEITKAALGTPGKYGEELSPEERLKRAGKSLVPFIPGGTQARKTIQGSQLLQRGFSQTPSGRARFIAPTTTGGKIKAVLFGQYSSPEARAWVNAGFPSLSDKQTATLKAKLDKPETAKFYFETVMKSKEEDQSTKIGNQIKTQSFDEIKKQYPREATFYSAETMFREINNISKDDVDARASKLQEFVDRGYDDPSVISTLNKIKDLKKDGMGVSDRQMILFSDEVRAQKIIDRLAGIQSTKKKKELLELYKKYGIINQEVEAAIIKLRR